MALLRDVSRVLPFPQKLSTLVVDYAFEFSSCEQVDTALVARFADEYPSVGGYDLEYGEEGLHLYVYQAPGGFRLEYADQTGTCCECSDYEREEKEAFLPRQQLVAVLAHPSRSRTACWTPLLLRAWQYGHYTA